MPLTISIASKVGITKPKCTDNHKIIEPLLLMGTVPSVQILPIQLSIGDMYIQILLHQNCYQLSLKKRRRFTLARLQAVLSKNMYSLHGLDALIGPPSGQVCHSLIVVSYCVPGSAQRHAA